MEDRPLAPEGSGAAETPLGHRQTLAWLQLQLRLAWHPERVKPLLAEGVPPEAILDRLDPCPADAVEGAAAPRGKLAARARRDAARLAAQAIRLLPVTNEDYPAPLRALLDAPPVLQVRGRVRCLQADCVAIVGARAATASARAQARRLGRELAGRGLTVVSGLARGVDAEAHRGALEVGGATVAVLAGGLDRLYPPEHRSLAREISEVGAIVTEMPLGTPPRRALFPLRNRIISGLCRGVVVVEARRRSGSLITVRHALDQGREVFVLPGASEGPFAEGSNRLLRDGARAISGAADVLEDLGFEARSADGGVAGRGASRRGLEGRVLALLEEGPRSREALLADLEPDSRRLAAALLTLELAGEVVEERDGRMHRAW